MSLLQDILDKMYVEPELLEQLDEEQKQTLFIKMREEQMRRWRIYEEEMSRRERENPQKPSTKRGIQWLKGRDGEIWVWVMGEHKDDPSIEEIIENETKRKAREIAEYEALVEMRADDNVAVSDLDENNLKKELSKMSLSDGNSLRPLTNGTQASNLSLYDDAMHATNNSGDAPKPVVSTPQQISYFPSYEDVPAKNPAPARPPPVIQPVNGTTTVPSPPKKPVPPPVPSRPAHLQKKPDPLPNGDYIQTIRSYTPGREPINVPVSVSQTAPITSTASQNVQKPITPVPQLTNNGPQRPPMQEVISNRPVPTEDVKFRTNAHARALSVSPAEIEKRQSEIFERMMEEHDRLQKEADAEEERRRRDFAEQERRAREAETKIRVIAQRARDQYARSMRTSDSLLPALNDTSASSLKEAIKRIRPPKPGSRQAIVKWYTEVEMPKGTGFDPKTNTPARWFHGIISRDTTERILAEKPPGSFIVRVSEKIWGYTISYVNSEHVIKHFLVETIPDGYQFLGTNQFVHKSLYDLVLYHETAPITAKGKEILRLPIGQSDINAPDYADLIDTAISFASFHNAFRRF